MAYDTYNEELWNIDKDTMIKDIGWPKANVTYYKIIK